MTEHVETSLIIGRGEIGKSLNEVFKRRGADVYIRDVRNMRVPAIDVLHIAFPYSDQFVHQVQEYIEQYAPSLTIVYSTVPVGTCALIGEQIVHSPVEGRHPDLTSSLIVGVRWLGCANKDALNDASFFWQDYVGTIRVVDNPAYTEFLKLRSTAKYGVNLVFADYEANVAKDLGMEYEAIQRWDKDYNTLYGQLGYSQFQRYILEPPGGVIGGHCVIPNAYLLDAQYPNDLLKMIQAMKPKEKNK